MAMHAQDGRCAGRQDITCMAGRLSGWARSSATSASASSMRSCTFQSNFNAQQAAAASGGRSSSIHYMLYLALLSVGNAPSRLYVRRCHLGLKDDMQPVTGVLNRVKACRGLMHLGQQEHRGLQLLGGRRRGLPRKRPEQLGPCAAQAAVLDRGAAAQRVRPAAHQRPKILVLLRSGSGGGIRNTLTNSARSLLPGLAWRMPMAPPSS